MNTRIAGGNSSSAFSFGTVLLGAGRSRRMGRPKLLLPWNGTSVLGHLVAQWRAAGAGQIGIVCAAGDRAIEAELERLGLPAAHRIVNPAPERGMFSSIQCAAQWPAWENALTHFGIVLGDQPHLRQTTLRALVRFAIAHPAQVCQPSSGGRPRHPVFLPKTAFFEIAHSRAETLKEFLARLQTATCQLEDPGLDLDLDSPADYEKALRLSASVHEGRLSGPQVNGQHVGPD
jgi:molybdenum cofactor cytidylyltransferase